MKIRWNDLVAHKNYKEYIILFYNSEINKKINKDEYKVIDFLSKNNIDVSLENSDYLDLFSNYEDAKYIYNYIKIFINQGILKVYESINKKNEEKNKITTLCIILTNKCNLRCRHCCQDAGYTKYVEYSKREWEKVIDLLFSYFDFDNIMISGGEPLIVDYMFDIVSYIEHKKKSMKFTLMTNGLLIDKNISLADLKGTLEVFVKKMLGENSKLRFRPSYFPFTEPSVEVDVSCHICNGKGCPTCKGTGWIEILGAGEVHPNVLKMAGYDPEKCSGFAFGVGIERVAMLKYGIDDIRHFYTNDKRFNSTFKRYE